MNQPYLDPASIEALQKGLDDLRKMVVNPRGRTLLPESPLDAPEVYLALTPASGIPARSGASVSSAVCQVYRILSEVLTDAGFDRTVYNLSSSAQSGNNYIRIERDKFGTWTVIEDATSASSLSTQETDLRCESGLLNLYHRTVTGGVAGAWRFSNTVACCDESCVGTGTGTDSTPVTCPCPNAVGPYCIDALSGITSQFCDLCSTVFNRSYTLTQIDSCVFSYSTTFQCSNVAGAGTYTLVVGFGYSSVTGKWNVTFTVLTVGILMSYESDLWDCSSPLTLHRVSVSSSDPHAFCTNWPNNLTLRLCSSTGTGTGAEQLPCDCDPLPGCARLLFDSPTACSIDGTVVHLVQNDEGALVGTDDRGSTWTLSCDATDAGYMYRLHDSLTGWESGGPASGSSAYIDCDPLHLQFSIDASSILNELGCSSSAQVNAIIDESGCETGTGTGGGSGGSGSETIIADGIFTAISTGPHLFRLWAKGGDGGNNIMGGGGGGGGGYAEVTIAMTAAETATIAGLTAGNATVTKGSIIAQANRGADGSGATAGAGGAGVTGDLLFTGGNGANGSGTGPSGGGGESGGPNGNGNSAVTTAGGTGKADAGDGGSSPGGTGTAPGGGGAGDIATPGAGARGECRVSW